jgi:hypothetical protein
LVQSPPLPQGTFFGLGAHAASTAKRPSAAIRPFITVIVSCFLAAIGLRS